MKSDRVPDDRKRSDLQWVQHLLSEAVALREAGQHSDALERLDEVKLAATGTHADIWMGLALAERARNEIQLFNDHAAMSALASLPASLRMANPGLEAICQLVRGFFFRRQAHEAWKTDRNPQHHLDDALSANEAGVVAAEMAHDKRLFFRLKLNNLNVRGLGAAIENKSKEKNPALVLLALPLEKATRDWTPPAEKNDLSGLTIIADLASGGGMSVADVFALNGDHVFESACRDVLYDETASWERLLLEGARDADVSLSAKSRALVLGTKLLLRMSDPDTKAIVSPYLTHLMDCFLRTRDSNPVVSTEIQRNMALLNSYVGSSPRGIRVFR